jgi:hypothetical protein
MDTNFELFEGKTLGDLCKDIVKNSEDKKQQIDILITDLRGMLKTIEDAVMIVPLLKDYYDVGVRNDEQLIKLGAIVARVMAGASKSEDAGNALLTDDDKKQLLEEIQKTVGTMNEKVPEINKEKLSVSKT